MFYPTRIKTPQNESILTQNLAIAELLEIEKSLKAYIRKLQVLMTGTFKVKKDIASKIMTGVFQIARKDILFLMTVKKLILVQTLYFSIDQIKSPNQRVLKTLHEFKFKMKTWLP